MLSQPLQHCLSVLTLRGDRGSDILNQLVYTIIIHRFWRPESTGGHYSRIRAVVGAKVAISGPKPFFPFLDTEGCFYKIMSFCNLRAYCRFFFQFKSL